MEFLRYQHIERFGTDEVDGIEIGECYVFPKLDGTNGQVYLGNDGTIKAGSRNRELTLDKDNQGFYAYVLSNSNIEAYLCKHPTHRLYGEWLVPHTLRTYREDAWNRFFVFDICIDRVDEKTGKIVPEYIPYDIYQPLLEEFGLDYIPPIAIIKNGSYESFVKCLEKNNFFIKDGAGVGEGVVIKNYSFYNKYGRQTWAKIITSEFKEKHHKAMGAPVIETKVVEQAIVDKYVTPAFVEKEFAKIVTEKSGWKSHYIPELLGRVYYELIHEEMWNILKEFKNPKIDFKMLHTMVIQKIKTVKKDIF